MDKEIEDLLEDHGAHAPSDTKNVAYSVVDHVLRCDVVTLEGERYRAKWNYGSGAWDHIDEDTGDVFTEDKKAALYWEDERHMWMHHAEQLQARLDRLKAYADETFVSGPIHATITKLVTEDA
jgi:hypothetical protein